MLRSPTIFNVKNIPIRIHWSFILFLAWIIFSNEQGITGGISEAIFAISIFSCVVLHELGHALTARFFGIGTRDITLYPIGGVALLNSDAPPLQELFIAIAGPLVNVLIAFLVFFVIDLSPETSPFLNEFARELTFLERFFLVNIVLVVFNLIPAYPMDGGRVTRSVLALFVNYDSATVISARIGQLCSLLMLAYALYSGQFILSLISFFIFSLASKEIRMIKIRRQLVINSLNEI